MRELPYCRLEILGDGDGSQAAAPVVVHDDDALRVVRTDRTDFGLRRGESREYVYSFATYEISVGADRLTARRYADTWHEVSIFASAPLKEIPYGDRSFRTTASYFFGLDDVRAVTVFVGTYVPVDRARCA